MVFHRVTLANSSRLRLEMPLLQEQLGREEYLGMATQIAEEKGVLGLENPMGTDGFEFVEYTAPDTSMM